MKNHFCPCFYTKQWGSEDGKIFYYRIINNKVVCKSIAPRNTGYEINLYAKKNTSIEDEHTIELKYYKKIDDKAAKIYQKILTQGLSALIRSEKNDWCCFMLSMMTRHASLVSSAKSNGLDIINRQKSLLTPIEQSYYKQEIDYWYNNVAVETLAAMVTPNNIYGISFLEKYQNTFSKMSWWIEDFSITNTMLLTSDYPIILAPIKKPSKKYNIPTDMLLSGEYLLSFPLSPYKCLYICADKNEVTKDINNLIEIQNYNTVGPSA